MTKRVFASLVLGVTGNVNADAVIGTRITMKKVVTWDQEIRAFVSPRCVRRGIRKALAEYPTNPPFQIDPELEKGGQLGDVGDPIAYVDDDIFGFFAPTKGVGNVQPARASPIKISPLMALHHTEIGVEFGGRFPRKDLYPKAQEGNPAPFEIETAKWVGELQVIATDRIGRIREITEDVEKKLANEYKGEVTEKDGVYELPAEERKRRAEAFFDVLLRLGWEFPRGSEAVSVPEFKYAVVAASDHFLPIGNVLRLDENLSLNAKSTLEALSIYDWEYSSVIDYNGKRITTANPHSDKLDEKTLSKEVLRDVVHKLAEYIA